MRVFRPCLAVPDIDRSFAERDRHQLRMEVGDVDERDVAKPVETQQVGLAQLLLSKGARPAAWRDRSGGCSNFKKLAPRRHGEARQCRGGKDASRSLPGPRMQARHAMHPCPRRNTAPPEPVGKIAGRHCTIISAMAGEFSQPTHPRMFYSAPS